MHAEQYIEAGKYQGMNALHVAVQSESLGLVDFLINHYKPLLTARVLGGEHKNKTALDLAKDEVKQYLEGVRNRK